MLAEAEEVVGVVTAWLRVVVFVFELKLGKLFGYCSFAAHRFQHLLDMSVLGNVIALVTLELDPICTWSNPFAELSISTFVDSANSALGS